MATKTLILGRNSLDKSTNADFDSWVAFVCAHIDEIVGFEVDVNEHYAYDTQTDDVHNANDAERKAIHEAVHALLELWSATGNGTHLTTSGST